LPRSLLAFTERTTWYFHVQRSQDCSIRSRCFIFQRYLCTRGLLTSSLLLFCFCRKFAKFGSESPVAAASASAEQSRSPEWCVQFLVFLDLNAGGFSVFSGL